MKLSVIIVNYNVKYFLEQCLCSLQTSLQQCAFEAEVLVIDNLSGDGSLDYLQPRFPEIRFLANDRNDGFAKANNRALQAAKGELVLFLNPDTLVSGETIRTCVDFFETQSGAGAVGVKMLDGSGTYLPESKRGFPTAWVSFCKMTGLTRIFPHSALFARYYLGNLNENSLQQVEALAGAFMMVRREVLIKTGGFDERFFMYAEDIDLSYRIIEAGHQNFYLPDAPIIHFKGESTQKDRTYITRFYGAMLLFVEKHYQASRMAAKMLRFAIRVRAWWAGLKNAKKAENAPILPEKSQNIIEKARKMPQNGVFDMGGYWLGITGEGFDHFQLIAHMQQHPGEQYYLHHRNSGAIITSGNSDDRGKWLLL